jgi:L-alanine-DL-glutamate epimerase-like enolase superfamily enzyme
MITLSVSHETWPVRGSFTISRGSRTEADVVFVELVDGEHRGRGECVPYARYGETPESVMAQLKGLEEAVASELDSDRLQDALPPGAARNALDCAYWDLDAKCAGKRVWDLALLPAPKPLISAYTLSLDTPEKMQIAAKENASRPLLKLKLAGPDDLQRVEAVRSGAPDADIIVDANEGWTADIYTDLAPKLAALGVKMIEQPLPAGDDAALGEIERPVPVCADESCHDRTSLPRLKGFYDIINIKLDKTGGLTEALALKAEAESMGFGVMVGCMLSTSLAMAPALLVAQGAQVVDLDGPLLLAKDREPPMRFEGSLIHPADVELWG